jgi:hypothetical protein
MMKADADAEPLSIGYLLTPPMRRPGILCIEMHPGNH